MLKQLSDAISQGQPFASVKRVEEAVGRDLKRKRRKKKYSPWAESGRRRDNGKSGRGTATANPANCVAREGRREAAISPDTLTGVTPPQLRGGSSTCRLLGKGPGAAAGLLRPGLCPRAGSRILALWRPDDVEVAGSEGKERLARAVPSRHRAFARLRTGQQTALYPADHLAAPGQRPELRPGLPPFGHWCLSREAAK